MKAIVSIVAAVVICAALLAFVISLKGRGPVEGAGFARQVEALVAGWTTGRVDLSGRVASIVLDDTSQGDDPLSAPEGPSGGGSFMGKLRSLFGGGGPPEPSVFARAFKAAEPASAVWTFEGFSTADEPAMVRAVMDAVVRANEAGGRVNIVARGAAAAVALKAVKGLEGAGPAQIVVNRLIVLGMNEEALMRLDPAFFDGFKRPRNLREWLNVWAERRSVPPAMPVTFYSPEAPGIRYYGPAVVGAQAIETLIGDPGAAGFPAAVAELARAVAGLARSAESLKSALDRATEVLREQVAAGPAGAVNPPGQTPQARAQAQGQAGQEGAPRARDFRALDGTQTRRPVGSVPQQSSLDMIRGGGMLSAGPAEQHLSSQPGASRQPGQASAGGKGAAGSSPAPNRTADQQKHDALCSKCCADLGGSWWFGSFFSGECRGEISCQAKWGCCQGADFRSTEPCLACSKFRIGDNNTGIPFRCW